MISSASSRYHALGSLKVLMAIGLDSHLFCSAHDANGDFAAVGYQYALNLHS